MCKFAEANATRPVAAGWHTRHPEKQDNELGDDIKPTAFPCTRCGLCCTQLDKHPAYRALDRGDGTCRHFDAVERLCSVYADRPDLCRTETMHRQHFPTLSPAEFHRINASLCNQAQQTAGLSERYRLIQTA